MKLFSILSAFLLISLSLSACVTTREQLNQQRGISGQNDSASDDETPSAPEKPVQSQDLKPQVVTPVKPVASQAVAQDKPTEKTTPMTAAASVVATAGAAVVATQGSSNAAPATAPQATTQPSQVSSSASTSAANVQPAATGNAPLTAPSSAPSVVSGAPSATIAPVPMPASTPESAIHLKGDLSQYSDDELRVEIARLGGRVEELEHDKQITDQSHQDAMKKANDHIADLEKKLKELQPDTPTLPAGLTPLAAGKQAFMDGKYDEAVVFTGQALEKQDTGKDAEEATYIRGESYFKKQQYNKAIVDFSRFPEKFQKSTYHPKALLRIAECFEAMGRKDDAKAFYSDLADKFPKTAEGKLAKKRMKSKV